MLLSFIYIYYAYSAVVQLDVRENLICKQLILKGELKCDQVQADRIVTEEIDIPTEFSSEVLELNSLSPFRSDTRSSAFIQEEDTILISANFQEIYRDNDEDENTTNQQTIQTDFIQIHEQSQWISVIVDDYSKYWIVQNKNQQNDFERLRQTLKQNSYYSIKQDTFKKAWLNKYNWNIDFRQSKIVAYHFDEIIFQYDQLPQNHTYVQLSGNFLMITDIWRQGTKLLIRVDEQLVWMQSYHQNNHVCKYLDHFLQELQLGHNLQEEIIELQNQEWSLPFLINVKHIKNQVNIEFSIQLGQIPTDCMSVSLFQELEQRMKIFGIDDFALHYK